MIIKYATVKRKPKRLLALTGLTLREFKTLLPAFARVLNKTQSKMVTQGGTPRLRVIGGGRKAVLSRDEDKLLFILVYVKTYPLQVVMSELFDMSVAGVNHWIHRLLPVVKQALEDLGVKPERNPQDFARREGRRAYEHEFIIDGTERRRQRPKDPEKQALHYSGKKKAHTDKNLVITDMKTKRVAFLSKTYIGKRNDKKIADLEGVRYPKRSKLYKDSGFQDYEPKVEATFQPKKT